MSEDHEARISVMEEQIKTFKDVHTEMASDVKILLAKLNQGKGAYAFALVVASSVGGVITAFLGGMFHK